MTITYLNRHSPDFRRFRGQDRASVRLWQRQIVPSIGNGRSKPPVTAR